MDKGMQDNTPRRRYSTEVIIGKLWEAEVLLSQGQEVGQVSRSLGISEQTYYRRAHSVGSPTGARSTAASRQSTGTVLRTDQARRLKALEQENSWLKRLVADLSLDSAMLRETVSGN